MTENRYDSILQEVDDISRRLKEPPKSGFYFAEFEKEAPKQFRDCYNEGFLSNVTNPHAELLALEISRLNGERWEPLSTDLAYGFRHGSLGKVFSREYDVLIRMIKEYLILGRELISNKGFIIPIPKITKGRDRKVAFDGIRIPAIVDTKDVLATLKNSGLYEKDDTDRRTKDVIYFDKSGFASPRLGFDSDGHYPIATAIGPLERNNEVVVVFIRVDDRIESERLKSAKDFVVIPGAEYEDLLKNSLRNNLTDFVNRNGVV